MLKYFHTLMRSLTEESGASLEFTDETQVYCNFDDFPLLIQFLPGAEQLLVAASVAEAPVKNREQFYRELLSGQYFFRQTGGGSLSLDEGASFVCLQMVRDIDSLTSASLLILLENFLHIAGYWRKRSEEFGQAAEAAEPEPEPDGTPLARNMMRV